MSRTAEPDAPYLMWGGRFLEPPDPRVGPLLTSLPVDRHLLRWDLLASLAHLTSLTEAGVIPPPVAAGLARELRQMVEEAEAGTLAPGDGFEDVHSFIESTLTTRLGPAAGWLPTGRSRNDQVVTAMRLDLRERIAGLVGSVIALQEALLMRAREVGDALVPGYTHSQRAQPLALAHHLLAYFWMLDRDTGRLRDAYRRLDASPLGSGAIAGTGYPVDRARQAALMGFAGVSENSVDATGDRDFVFETVAAVTGLLVHLSRWAEELVLWTTREFGFINLPDALATGSSLMPQKRNPDLLELVRAQAGVVLGPLVTIAVVQKGVPLGYSRDLQEDKSPVLTAFRSAGMALAAMTLVVGRMVFQPARIREALRGGHLTATDVADYLVRRRVPFREAHRLAGQAVCAAEAAGCELGELALEAYHRISPEFEGDVLDAVTPEGSVASKDVSGGTAPARVSQAMVSARAALDVQRSWLTQVRAAQQAAVTRLLSKALELGG